MRATSKNLHSSGHSANNCEEVGLAQSGPSSQPTSPATAIAILHAPLSSWFRWAAKEEQADFYFRPGRGS